MTPRSLEMEWAPGSAPRASTAARALRSCAMPEGEIRSVLRAEDPEVVRRHVELHIERLEERLARQRRILRGVQRRLSPTSLLER